MAAYCLEFIKWGEEKAKRTTRGRTRAAFIVHTHKLFAPVYTYTVTVVSSLSFGNINQSLEHHCQGCCSHQKRTYEEQFWPPNVGIVSFQLGNYLIFSYQKLRHMMEAYHLISSTADGGESGTLKGNSTYQPLSLDGRHHPPEV